MNEIYYESGGTKLGPINIAEIKPFQIHPDTLIWHEGLKDWTAAKNIPEFTNYFKKLPPPLPIEIPKKKQSKYDLTYKPQSDALSIGLILLVLPVILNISGIVQFSTSPQNILLLALILTLFIRIIIPIWVYSIAKMQNRNSILWCISSVFFPSIVLICIGLTRRIRIEGQMTYEEYLKLDDRTIEQINLDKKNAIRLDFILKSIALTLVLGGLLTLILIFIFL